MSEVRCIDARISVTDGTRLRRLSIDMKIISCNAMEEPLTYSEPLGPMPATGK